MKHEKLCFLFVVICILFWSGQTSVQAGPILVIDNASGGAADTIASHLNNVGYFVVQQAAADTDASTWPGYDFIVWSCGNNANPVGHDYWRTDLENYVGAGHKLWIEGGEIAYAHEFDPNFAPNVLFMASWRYVAPAGDIIFQQGYHPIMTLPNYLTSPVTHTYLVDEDQDIVEAASNAETVAQWSNDTFGYASIIAHDDDTNMYNGGQVVFTCFNFNNLESSVQEPLAENIAAYLTGGAPTPTPTATPVEPTPTPRPTYCRNPDVAIPDHSQPTPFVTDTLIITDDMEITDLDVYIYTEHTWVGDLIFTLEHVDTGTSVVIIDRPGDPAVSTGCREDDIDATLDDEASDPVEDECSAVNPAAIYGRFYPNNPLSAFDGESIAGTWQLTVSDNSNGDTGTLHTWCLEPAFPSEPTPPALPATDTGGIGFLIAVISILLAGTALKRF